MREKSVSFEDAVLRAPTLDNIPRISLKNNEIIDNESEEEPELENGKRLDYYFAVILFVITFLTMKFTNLYNIDWFNTGLMMSYLGISLCYVIWHKYEINRKNIFLFIFILIAYVPNAIYTNNELKLVNLVFLNILQMYWLLSCCNHLSEDKESNWVIFDFFASFILVPFTYLKKTICFLFQSSISILNIKTLVKILVGILLSIPILVVIVPLLSTADSGFQKIFENLFQNLDVFVNFFTTFLCTVPLFLYYYSTLYANNCCEVSFKEKKFGLEKVIKRLGFISPIIVATLEVVLCITYVLFIAATCVSIYTNLTATDVNFSYSTYAREGFFELCKIVVINFLLMMLIDVLNKNKNTFANRLAKSTLCLETICIIFTASFRLGMYMYAFGLTYLRVYSMWLMIVMLGVFLIILFHTFKKGNEVLHMVYCVCICFFLLNLCNIDGLIKTVNDTTNVEENIVDVFE